jgi:uncharacterized protein (DUF2141 family)
MKSGKREYFLMNRYAFMLILMFLSSAFGLENSSSINVHVKIEGFRTSRGNCYLLLFKDKKGFPESEKHAAVILKNSIVDNTATFIFDTSPGIYAISVLHDENLNEKLDKTWYGKPVEGFGISNNPKINFGPPSFKKSSISLKEKDNFVSITMKYF